MAACLVGCAPNTTETIPRLKLPGPSEPVEVGSFAAQVTLRPPPAGLPSLDVLTIAVGGDAAIYAGTAKGLARLAGDAWKPIADLAGLRIEALATHAGGVLAAAGGELFRVTADGVELLSTLPDAPRYLLGGESVLLATSAGLWELDGERQAFVPKAIPIVLSPDARIHQLARGPNGELVLGTSAGLYHFRPEVGWLRLFPRAGPRRWAPAEVRGVAYDSEGRLWFASLQGIGRYDGESWDLYTAEEGLPYNAFTTMRGGVNGAVWLGTELGAIRFDGERWEYRQGRRWLPDDRVRAIAVSPEGDAWFATAAGVGGIAVRQATLGGKAAQFLDQLDRRHLRTPYGYVNSVTLTSPGDPSQWTPRVSDNDGLWTGMYGAACSFAYAATGEERHRERARRAFEALRFLGQVTQGGTHPAPPGFVARTILSVDGPDPNEHYTLKKDEQRKAERDRLWRVFHPRWPLSADGNWYWKADSSSDELDGHFFFYAQYHDLVAKDDDERREVAEVVEAITDHLLNHQLRLVDWEGPTRWANYAPESLNHDRDWHGERGLNSLSILSYLKVAEHICGHSRYGDAYRRLVEDHAYAQNVLHGKNHQGPGTGNQSDSEMAFMGFYNLLHYEDDPQLRGTYALAFRRYWELERWELNPLFNFLYAAACWGDEVETPWGTEVLRPDEAWLEESVDTLKRFPMDRIRWGVRNSHRLDLVALPSDKERKRGRRADGRALPIDERWVEHWNTDPWRLDDPGTGEKQADGVAFLLPYYLGLYEGFIAN